jgi:hypothetical protein
MKEYYNIQNVKPINIPNELMKPEYLKRNVWDFYPYQDDKTVFVKSKNKIKGYSNIIRYTEIPTGEFLVSDLIDIDSEWRSFVYNGELVGLQNYAGDFTIFPDVELIENMIKDYKDCPPAYTLDVGINQKDGTFVIEAHAFWSCGLYGFSNNSILPMMFIKAFNWQIAESKNN